MNALKIAAGVALICLIAALPCFTDTHRLYYSAQTGMSTTFEGSRTYSADDKESGSATITATGPIEWGISEPLTLNPNEGKTWSGWVRPDAGFSASPGTCTPASLTGNYTFIYYDDDGNEVKRKSDSHTENFNIYSIECVLSWMMWMPIHGTASITASSYPSGGSYMWSVGGLFSASGVNSQTITLTDIGGYQRIEPISLRYSFDEVTYDCNGNIFVYGIPGRRIPGPGLPEVSIEAVEGAAEPDDPGAFLLKVSAGWPRVTELHIGLEFSGIAEIGTDYDMISDPVIMPDSTVKVLHIQPIDDQETEGDETIKIRLREGTAYVIVEPGEAQILIKDDD